MCAALPWLATVFNIAAGLLLAGPGWRLSRDLLAIRTAEESESGHPEFDEEVRYSARRFQELLNRWDATDHWLIASGLGLFILAGVIDLVDLATTAITWCP